MLRDTSLTPTTWGYAGQAGKVVGGVTSRGELRCGALWILEQGSDDCPRCEYTEGHGDEHGAPLTEAGGQWVDTAPEDWIY